MKIILILSLVLQSVIFGSSTSASVYYEWKQIDYETSLSEAAALISEGKYDPIKIILSSVKIDPKQPRMIVTTPRWQNFSPYTLGVIPLKAEGDTSTTGPILKPFPSTFGQKEGSDSCSTNLQLVQDGDIDAFGRLWIPDIGRTNIFPAGNSVPNNNCKPKLVVVDLQDNDKIVYVYEFPEDVASSSTNILRAIQVSCRNPADREDCMVYISNPGEEKMVMFDFKTKTSWSAQDKESMKTITEDGSNVYILGNYPTFGIDGMAISPEGDYIYYAQLTGTKIYRIPTTALKNAKTNPTLNPSEISEVTEIANTDSIAMTSSGTLYFGQIQEHAEASIQTSSSLSMTTSPSVIAQDSKTITWTDTWGFDGRGNLFFTSDNYLNWDAGKINPNEVNYRIMKLEGTGNIYASNWVQ